MRRPATAPTDRDDVVRCPVDAVLLPPTVSSCAMCSPSRCSVLCRSVLLLRTSGCGRGRFHRSCRRQSNLAADRTRRCRSVQPRAVSTGPSSLRATRSLQPGPLSSATMHSFQLCMRRTAARCIRRAVAMTGGGSMEATAANPAALTLDRSAAAAAAVAPSCIAAARPAAAVALWRSTTRAFSHSARWQQSKPDGSASGAAPPAASTAPRAGLLPSQAHIILPQLSPRMSRGSLLRWLVSDGSRLEPHQVFAQIYTSELTEDGTPYILEMESHESGVVRRILQKPMLADKLSAAETDLAALDLDTASPALLTVGTPIALFEDPDWVQGDRPRGEFLWQAYVSAGKMRQGSCTPQRQEEEESGAAGAPQTDAPTPPAASAEASTAASADPTTLASTPKKKRTAPKRKV